MKLYDVVKLYDKLIELRDEHNKACEFREFQDLLDAMEKIVFSDMTNQPKRIIKNIDAVRVPNKQRSNICECGFIGTFIGNVGP